MSKKNTLLTQIPQSIAVQTVEKKTYSYRDDSTIYENTSQKASILKEGKKILFLGKKTNFQITDLNQKNNFNIFFSEKNKICGGENSRNLLALRSLFLNFFHLL